jgi:hypothetical protein
MKNQQWNESSIRSEAKKYTLRKEFKTGAPGAYRAANRLGILDSACEHMPTPRKLTKEIVYHTALKYATRTAFAEGADSEYRSALRKGYLDEVCGHMERDVKWTRDKVLAESLKFSLRYDFEKNSSAAYQAAKRLGIYEMACAHMKPKKRILDKATVAEIAKKYSTRKEFQRGDKGAYNAGFKKDWLDDVCAHMRSATCGFNNGLPGKLYQIKFTLPNGDNLWKIGITNGELSIRLRSIGIPDYIHSEIVCVASFDDGKEARKAERYFIRKGRRMGLQYDGDPFLRNGNTEVFYEPLA